MGRPPRRHPGTPHPPQCAHWGTFPPAGGRLRARDARPYRVGSYPPVARGTPALRRQAPTAARRARPVQRSGCQGLPGDRRGPPRRGSACHETKKGTGRGCTPGSCFVCTAFRRHEPPYWGVQGGRSPPALLSPHFFGKKWGRPPRRHPPGGWAPPDGRILSAPTGLAVGVPRWSGPPPGDAPVSGQKSAPPGIRAALVFTALRGNTPNQGWQAAACRGCCAGR